MTEPGTRASDADRDQAALLLGDSLVAGRLSVQEFNERLDKALTAKTLGELAALSTDLPAVDLGAPDSGLPSGRGPGAIGAAADGGRRPGRQALSGRWPGPATTGSGRLSPSWRAAWGSWLTISMLAFVIWVLGGGSGSLWFLWVLLPLGALLLGRWVMEAPAPRDRRQARRGVRGREG